VRLLISIPTLNEEATIAGVIDAAVPPRATISTGAPMSHVKITVISDGLTDRTDEIASRTLEQINLIVFERNRAHGTACKFC
jgi:dolichol-phosphate hexosyltransferase